LPPKCGFCPAYFKDLTELKHHLYKDHIELIVSTLINSAANSQPDLSSSKKGNSSEMEAFCNICKKEVCNKYFLKSHLLNKHGVALDDYLATQHLYAGNNSTASSSNNAALVAAAAANELIENHTHGLNMSVLNQLGASKMMAPNGSMSFQNGKQQRNGHININGMPRSASPMAYNQPKQQQHHHYSNNSAHHYNNNNHHHHHQSNSSYSNMDAGAGYMDDDDMMDNNNGEYPIDQYGAYDHHSRMTGPSQHLHSPTAAAMPPYANSEENMDEMDDMIMLDNMGNAIESAGQAGNSSNSELFNHYLKLAMQQQQQQQQQQGGSGNLDIYNEQPHQQQQLTTSFPSTGGGGKTEDFCEICQKQFCNKYYLRKHKQDVHGVVSTAASASSGEPPAADKTPKNIRKLINELSGNSKNNQNAKGLFYLICLS
jgi:hypothetical protein